MRCCDAVEVMTHDSRLTTCQARKLRGHRAGASAAAAAAGDPGLRGRAAAVHRGQRRGLGSQTRCLGAFHEGGTGGGEEGKSGGKMVGGAEAGRGEHPNKNRKIAIVT